MRKIAVVTGGSSGIGLATALMLADKGYGVYALSRRGTGQGQKEGIVTHISADVTDRDSLSQAFQRIYQEEGRLDLLVNSAGFGISGAAELTDPQDARRLFEVNFFGALASIQCAVPYLRESGGGRIVSLSSVAAPIAIPFQAFYSCSKAAINDLSLALDNELRPFGIRSIAVMPGDVKTGFTGSREKNESGSHLYGDAIQRAVSSMERDEENGMTPESVARVILKAAEAKSPKPLYTAGGKYKLFVLIAKLLPIRLVNFLVGKLYG